MIHESAMNRYRNRTLAYLALSLLIAGAISGCAHLGGQPQQGAQTQSTSFFLFNTLYFFALVYLGYYMLILRPKIAVERDHKEFISGLKKGSEVMTSGGIYGRVSLIQGEIITIDIDTNSRLRVHEEFIQQPRLAAGSTTAATQTKSAQG